MYCELSALFGTRFDVRVTASRVPLELPKNHVCYKSQRTGLQRLCACVCACVSVCGGSERRYRLKGLWLLPLEERNSSWNPTKKMSERLKRNAHE